MRRPAAMTVSAPLVLTGALEVLLASGGTYLLWTRRRAWLSTPPALAAWEVPWPDFLRFLLFALMGTLLGNGAASLLLRGLGLTGIGANLVAGAGTQLGMLAGALLGAGRAAGESRPPALVWLRSGAATFLIAVPVLMATGALWHGLLRLLGIEAQPQDLLDMFRRAGSPWLLSVMIGLAVVVAPIAEELVFRRGLFRYLRTRLPRVLAVLIPALLFAALHANLASLAPLAVLAAVFSLAYERTGHIGTCIVAHGLFNLNTILLVLSGAGDLA